MRNLLATLLLAQGTPMLLGGDEFGRTQLGNNNAYCQDNEINWFKWQAIGEDGRLLIEFTAPADRATQGPSGAAPDPLPAWSRGLRQRVKDILVQSQERREDRRGGRTGSRAASG